jgi:RNA polymerase sigma-70 factor (ECF subfamily)
MGRVRDEPALADLRAGFRRGEAAALRGIYALFADRIFRFLVRLCGRVDLAEDLHQETWVAAVRAATRLTGDTDLAAWLYTIARNKYRSHRRWQRLRGEWLTAPAELPQAIAAPEADPGVRHDLERALSALPATHREVLLLVGCEGLGHHQAAIILGISVEATRQRLSRARAALAEALGEPGAPDNVLVMRKGAP